ncbi:MAG TPA: glycosyltransferase [Acidimicrobiia bacterium]|nr:glycosyltransferase [Acidimicrobiia bacterium]
MEHLPIDVVVPVYNGHDAVARCLASVVAHTPGAHVRIVVADDASPDPRLPGLLASFAAADRRVVVVRRPQNLGFVRNCNLALREARGDVVLLNSDTEVPPGWLERLHALAHSSARVGSVTPLSDNATICSVPQWLVPNRFPPAVDTSYLDEVAATAGTGEWLEIPTSVGFCVYLRREALDACGPFDEELFGAGYGEENDLACRMRDRGYLNLLCDTVLVRHEGGVSFAEAGGGDLPAHLDRITERWPAYHEVIRGFIERNPLWGVQARFGIELLRRSKSPQRRRVLYLIHNRLWSGVIGGSELHLSDLVESLGDRVDPLVVSFDDADRGTVQWRPEEGMVLQFPIQFGGASEPQDWVDRLLATGIDLIHIQHTMRAPMAFVDALLDRALLQGIPVVWTLHDYYPLCPSAQLLDAETGAPCTSLEDGSPCAGCEDRARRLAGLFVPEWRDVHRFLLGRARLLITPSRAARDVLVGSFPELAPSIRVIPHGVPAGRPLPPRPDGPHRQVAVLGYGGRHKGDGLLEQVIDALAEDEVTWHFFGRERFGTRPRRQVVLHGTYRRDDLARLLAEAEIDLVLLLSPWAETYSYTLSEAWRLGLPVAGSNLGAIEERIGAHGGGVTVDPWDPPAVAETLRSLFADPGTLARLAREAADVGRALPTLEDMGAAYARLYAGLAPAPRPAAPAPLRLTPDPEEMRGWMGSFRSPLPA